MREADRELVRAELRPMREEDLPEVRRIDAESLARPWTEGIWREELRGPFGSYLVAEFGGEAVGYVGLKYTADELHVMNIAVRPESRRQGLARRLLLAAVSGYPEASKIYLEVRPSNAPARALYESLGFSTIGRRPRYYGDEDALIMSLSL
jgi:ribosomal-protein-alanine N-acetyltransferase